MTYGLFGKFSAQPGKRDDLVGYLLQAAKLLERNPGCVHYIVSTSEEPEAVWVSEVWTDEAAHDASLEPEDIQALIQEARPCMAARACLAESRRRTRCAALADRFTERQPAQAPPGHDAEAERRH